jgi:hypothetical protein
MLQESDVKIQLARLRRKNRTDGEQLVHEAKRILNNDLFTETKILENLKHYNTSFGVLDEEDLDPSHIFTLEEIKQVAVMYRLKFLESNFYKPEIPYEAVLKIKHLNESFGKEIKTFSILAHPTAFRIRERNDESLLFVRTNHDNFYLVHRWGKEFKSMRKIENFPFRNFETLALTVVAVTLLITAILPTRFITLDSKATYWCGYRAAAFFHLLIFNLGMTIYFTFAFGKNFSSSTWNKVKDFG